VSRLELKLNDIIVITNYCLTYCVVYATQTLPTSIMNLHVLVDFLSVTALVTQPCFVYYTYYIDVYTHVGP